MGLLVLLNLHEALANGWGKASVPQILKKLRLDLFQVFAGIEIVHVGVGHVKGIRGSKVFVILIVRNLCRDFVSPDMQARDEETHQLPILHQQQDPSHKPMCD